MISIIRPALFVVSTLVMVVSSGGAAAQTVTVTSGRDTTLYESAAGDLANGSGTAMIAGRNGQPTESVRRALVWFDVAGKVPAGSTITSVELRLYNTSSNVDAEVVALHRMSTDWGEGASAAGGGSGGGGQGGGAPAEPGDATWLHTFYDSSLWSVAGGDFSVSSSGSAAIAGEGDYAWDSAELVSDVQSWLDAPSTNHGWCLMGNEASAGTTKRFVTREDADAARRPRLVIGFTGPAVPAAGTWGVAMMALLLMCAASLLFLRRGLGCRVS